MDTAVLLMENIENSVEAKKKADALLVNLRTPYGTV